MNQPEFLVRKRDAEVSDWRNWLLSRANILLNRGCS